MNNKSEIRIMHSDRGIYEIQFPEKAVHGFLANDGTFFDTVDIPEGETLVTSSRTEKYRYYKYKATVCNAQKEALKATTEQLMLEVSNFCEDSRRLAGQLTSEKAHNENLMNEYDECRGRLHDATHKANILEKEKRNLESKLNRMRELHREDISYCCELPFFKWLIRIYRK